MPARAVPSCGRSSGWREMREPKSRVTFKPLSKVAGVFAVVGAFLFMRVWWPIQAERSLTQLKKVEAKIFEKKSELNILNERYASLTSLSVLDQWAKKNGPWVPPNAENVIALQ